MDRADNRWANLRMATRAQNKANTRPCAANTSGVKGVHWHKSAHKWRARIKVNGKRRHLGFFCTPESAAAAYAAAAEKYFGEFSRTE
jgi:hypothetical protein